MKLLHESGAGVSYVAENDVCILCGTTLHTTQRTVSADTVAFAAVVGDKICHPSRRGMVFAARRCEGGTALKSGFDEAKAAYGILSACGETQRLGFDEFYVSLQKKLAKERAHIAVEYQSGAPVSVAMTLFETCNGAYISGVATLPEKRHEGFGTAAVTRLCDALTGKTAYVMYRPELNKFYEKLGFLPVKHYTFTDVGRE